MAKKVLIISTSLRSGSNSEILAKECEKGALAAGHDVELLSLKGKDIKFCIGCLYCQSKGTCVLKDDVAEIMEKVLAAEVIVYATPIYYYEMSGQMKTLLDRTNPLYQRCSFQRVYLLTAAADDSEGTPDRALAGLGGWIECFEPAVLAGSVFAGGVNDPGEIAGHAALAEAYALGRSL